MCLAATVAPPQGMTRRSTAMSLRLLGRVDTASVTGMHIFLVFQTSANASVVPGWQNEGNQQRRDVERALQIPSAASITPSPLNKRKWKVASLQ